MPTFPPHDAAVINSIAKSFFQNTLHPFPVKFHHSCVFFILVRRQQGIVPLPTYAKTKSIGRNCDNRGYAQVFHRSYEEHMMIVLNDRSYLKCCHGKSEHFAERKLCSFSALYKELLPSKWQQWLSQSQSKDLPPRSSKRLQGINYKQLKNLCQRCWTQQNWSQDHPLHFMQPSHG